MDDVQTTAELFGADGLNKARDINVDRATLYAEWIFAVKAAIGLGDCHLFGEALIYRAEVLCADISWLFVISGTRSFYIRNVATIYLWHAHLVSSYALSD